MLHHYTETERTNASHWATGMGTATAGDCAPPILAQISNARSDQVRIPMRPEAARAFRDGLRLMPGTLPGTSLRSPVYSHHDQDRAQEGDGFALYSLADGRIRVDFHWRRDYAALLLTPGQAEEFADGIDRHLSRSLEQTDRGCLLPRSWR